MELILILVLLMFLFRFAIRIIEFGFQILMYSIGGIIFILILLSLVAL